MHKYLMLFAPNMTHCMMEIWEVAQYIGAKHPAHRTAVFLPHHGHKKADVLRSDRREFGELSKAEWSSPNRIDAEILLLSRQVF